MDIEIFKTETMNPEPHPDTIPDWKATKKIRRQSREAADDASIAAYLKAYNDGRSEEDIKQAYFEAYQKTLKP
jgi:hypothetical protein